MSWRQEERNLRTSQGYRGPTYDESIQGTTRTGTVYASWQKVREWQLYIPQPTTASDLVNSIFDVISEGAKGELLDKGNCTLPSSCGSGGGKGSSIQHGGDKNEKLLDTLAWGITGAIIAASALGGVAVWGYIENYLAGSWLVPRLCTFGEYAATAVSMGPRGAASCAARQNRYAWMSRIISAIFITSGGVAALANGPAWVKERVKELLKSIMGMVGGTSKALLAFIGYSSEDGGKASEATDEQFEDGMVQWVNKLQQDPQFKTNIPVEELVKGAVPVNENNETAKQRADSGQAPAQQSWNEWWSGIVTKANQGKGGGGKRRRRTRHRKYKNKKSKRRMSKRKASKRRRNKRNKTRR